MRAPGKGGWPGHFLAPVVLAIMAITGGCSPMTLFLETIETREVRTVEENFQGWWTSEQLNDGFDGEWVVQVKGGSMGAYHITMTNVAPEPGKFGNFNDLAFTGHLVTLGGRTWIDLVQNDARLGRDYSFTDLPETVRRHHLPVHLVGRINLGIEKTTVEWLAAEWLEEYLEDNPADLDFLSDSNLVIASTETVQNFLAAKGKDWATNEEPWVFERVKGKGDR